MSRKTRTVLVVAVVAALFGWRALQQRKPDAPKGPPKPIAAQPAPERKLGSIAFKPCTLSPPMGAQSLEAQCGTLSVAENPALPNGRRIALNIAWIPAGESGNHDPDPVFLIAGGPGQSATESFPAMIPAFRDVSKNRDIVMVDQRGTGKSNPLQCKDDDADGKTTAAVETDVDADESPEAARAMAVKCRDQLARTADLRFYTTTDAVRDLDAVRAAIGARQVNLMGVSYGTRVAQQYAMRYPQHTRTIVLDSVAPNAIHLGNDFARNLESALDLQFGQCAKTPGCTQALGDPRARLNALMVKLRAESPLVKYRDAATGEMKEERLRPGHVAGLARMYAYAPLAASILPLLLNEADQGRYENLMSLSKMLGGSMSDMMAYGMQLSVVCTEDAAGLKADASMASSLLGNSLVDLMQAQCAVWPHGDMPKDFHAPLATKVPALLLSGELDPVTPPSYAAQVAKTLPNGREFVLRGQGHNVIAVGCMPKLWAQFLETADAKALDAKCLDSLAYTPPFTTFNGWEP
ncbi:alpha/beta fold hydrolase [Noviluteimonas dokdonensis]|nr:alpha/beta fold hydrolase [Lysobacter dokdonensis]